MINYTPAELELNALYHANAAPYNPEWFNLFPSFWSILAGVAVMAGLFILGKYFWMVVYEIRFGLGDEYISGKLTKQKKIWLKEKYPLFKRTHIKGLYLLFEKRRFKEWLRK